MSTSESMRERANQYVHDGRTHELSYYKKKAVLVLLVLVVCLSEELRVRTWTPSKVGLQPRRSMSMSHTHCVLGWEGHD